MTTTATTTAAPITNVKYYKNETKKGNPTATKVKQGTFYYTYGTREANPDLKPRGQWWSREGPERYGDVVNWAAGNAKQHKYTYTMVLSLRDGPMQPEDFTAAMAAASDGIFAQWALIPHYDTNHDHAHVVAFRDKTLTKAEFHRWRKAAGAALAAAEQQRLQEAAQQRARQAEQSRRKQQGVMRDGPTFDDDLAFDGW